jgi:methionine synthase / methylenetetrahydrofolate reductase(NADPH)
MSDPSFQPSLLDRLKKSVLVADGAMGTMVSQLSPHAVDCIECLTLTNPELIADIHRQYVRAGAHILETNTFAANRIALSRFGMEAKTGEINKRAVALARTEAGALAYVAGSIGPLRTSSGGDATEVGAIDFTGALTEQLEALLNENIDLIIFETFSDATDLLEAVRIAKRLSTVPVLASMTAGRFGTTASGELLFVTAKKLIDQGADIIGLNCGYGIRAIEGAMEYLSGLRVPLSVMPNAGFPEQIGGRLRYGASEEYLANEALVLAQMGARIIGGCCGTTPGHIEAIAKKLREKRITVKPRVRHEFAPVREDSPFKPGKLLTDIASVKLPVICEIDPPATLRLERNTGAILAAIDAGADAISMADNPLATIKIENMAFAAHIKKLTPARIIVHLTGRDRNLLGIQSFMLGAHLLGIESLLCVTGDPSTLHGGPSNVFDANSLGLIKMAANLNRGKNLLGKEIGAETDFSIGAAVNPNMTDFSPQVRHLRNKVTAGARFAMTQPMYDAEKIRAFVQATGDAGIKIFIGIMPVLSSRTAEYLHHEVPGISIPESLRNALKKRDDPGYQMETGLDHARNLIAEIAVLVDGLYLIAPYTRPEILADLVRFAKKLR